MRTYTLSICLSFQCAVAQSDPLPFSDPVAAPAAVERFIDSRDFPSLCEFAERSKFTQERIRAISALKGENGVITARLLSLLQRENAPVMEGGGDQIHANLAIKSALVNTISNNFGIEAPEDLSIEGINGFIAMASSQMVQVPETKMRHQASGAPMQASRGPPDGPQTKKSVATTPPAESHTLSLGLIATVLIAIAAVVVLGLLFQRIRHS